MLQNFCHSHSVHLVCHCQAILQPALRPVPLPPCNPPPFPGLLLESPFLPTLAWPLHSPACLLFAPPPPPPPPPHHCYLTSWQHVFTPTAISFASSPSLFPTALTLADSVRAQSGESSSRVYASLTLYHQGHVLVGTRSEAPTVADTCLQATCLGLRLLLFFVVNICDTGKVQLMHCWVSTLQRDFRASLYG